jgi:hypothetical protein
MHQATGKTIIIIGIAIFIIGLMWYFWGNKLHFLGRLPGDIRVEREAFRFYFPITTMILLSLLLSVVFHLIKKFL